MVPVIVRVRVISVLWAVVASSSELEFGLPVVHQSAAVEVPIGKSENSEGKDDEKPVSEGHGDVRVFEKLFLPVLSEMLDEGAMVVRLELGHVPADG